MLPASPRSCWDFNSLPIDFHWYSFELRRNRLPNYKAFLKNSNHFAIKVSFGFLKTFYWISLPAGFQLHHDSVEIPIRFLWFSFGVLMNREGIACQLSKHSYRFQLNFVSSGFQLHHDPVDISIRVLWFSFGFLMNYGGIACQLSKHSWKKSIALPKRFPLVR